MSSNRIESEPLSLNIQCNTLGDIRRRMILNLEMLHLRSYGKLTQILSQEELADPWNH